MYRSVIRALARLQLTVPVLVMRLSSNFNLHRSSTSEDAAAVYYDRVIASPEETEPADGSLRDSEDRGWCGNTARTHPQPKTDNLNVFVSNSTDRESEKYSNNSGPRPVGGDEKSVNDSRYHGLPRRPSDQAGEVNITFKNMKNIRHQLLIVSLYSEDLKSEVSRF